MEPNTHEQLYAALKSALQTGNTREERLDLQAMADRFRVSVTPIREVLFRLIGENLVVSRPFGGFAVVVPDALALRDLYAWNAQHLMAALHSLSDPIVAQAVAPVGRALELRTTPDPLELIEQLFMDLARATGNQEFTSQVSRSNDRLRLARRVEGRIIRQPLRELQSLVGTDLSDVKNGFRRRLLAYHRRRIERASQIAALL